MRDKGGLVTGTALEYYIVSNVQNQLPSDAKSQKNGNLKLDTDFVEVRRLAVYIRPAETESKHEPSISCRLVVVNKIQSFGSWPCLRHDEKVRNLHVSVLYMELIAVPGPTNGRD
jgi:hypothetical protein